MDADYDGEQNPAVHFIVAEARRARIAEERAVAELAALTAVLERALAMLSRSA